MISISRAEGPVRLPADFQLLLAANSCPCGKLGMNRRHSFQFDEIRQGDFDKNEHDDYYLSQATCLCSPEEINRYWRKFGGALLDRIELRAVVVPSGIKEIGAITVNDEKSAVIAERVVKAVEIQQQRFKGTALRRNSLIPAGKIDFYCPLTDQARAAFHKALARLGLSGRAYHGIQKVARTIADLDNKEVIDTTHILEAVYHRRYGEDPYDILTV